MERRDAEIGSLRIGMEVVEESPRATSQQGLRADTPCSRSGNSVDHSDASATRRACGPRSRGTQRSPGSTTAARPARHDQVAHRHLLPRPRCLRKCKNAVRMDKAQHRPVAGHHHPAQPAAVDNSSTTDPVNHPERTASIAARNRRLRRCPRQELDLPRTENGLPYTRALLVTGRSFLSIVTKRSHLDKQREGTLLMPRSKKPRSPGRTILCGWCGRANCTADHRPDPEVVLRRMPAPRLGIAPSALLVQ
jgi:hypothetical protein